MYMYAVPEIPQGPNARLSFIVPMNHSLFHKLPIHVNKTTPECFLYFYSNLHITIRVWAVWAQLIHISSRLAEPARRVATRYLSEPDIQTPPGAPSAIRAWILSANRAACLPTYLAGRLPTDCSIRDILIA